AAAAEIGVRHEPAAVHVGVGLAALALHARGDGALHAGDFGVVAVEVVGEDARGGALGVALAVLAADPALAHAPERVERGFGGVSVGVGDLLRSADAVIDVGRDRVAERIGDGGGEEHVAVVADGRGATEGVGDGGDEEEAIGVVALGAGGGPVGARAARGGVLDA